LPLTSGDNKYYPGTANIPEEKEQKMSVGENKKIRVAGYGRVSTQGQVKDGTSAEDQRRRVKKECEYKGYILYKFYSDDGISGMSLKNRPAIQNLISDAKEGKFDLVMFTGLDRLARNLREMLNFLHLIKGELKLGLYCTDDPSLNTDGLFGRAMLNTLGTFAELEHGLIRERTIRGKTTKLKKGEIFPGSSPPYVYHWNKEKKEIEVVPEEREIYRRIVSLYLDQHYSMKDIAMILSGDAVPTPSGRAKYWSSTMIGKILRNPAYNGKPIIYNQYYHKRLKKDKSYTEPDKNSAKPEKDWIIRKFPPVISEKRWNLIQERIQQQKVKPTKKHKGYENHFLTKKALGKALRCGECGSTMTQKLRGDNGKPIFYYACNWKICSQKQLDLAGRERCILRTVNAEYVDKEVYKSVKQLMSNPVHFGKQWLSEYDPTQLKKEIKDLEKRIKDLDRKIGKAYDLIDRKRDPYLEKAFESRLRDDCAEKNRLESKLELKQTELEGESSAHERLKELRQYVKGKRGKVLSEVWKPRWLDDRYETTFKGFLIDLPFEEKKRIIEAVIAPEAGGKVYIRYPRTSDIINPDEFEREEDTDPTPDEWRSYWRDAITDKDPIIDLSFDIDIDRLKAVVMGLDREELWDKFESCAIPGKGKDAH
jgi:site-specific DNA recombinase